jgi:hypothetical protein
VEAEKETRGGRTERKMKRIAFLLILAGIAWAQGSARHGAVKPTCMPGDHLTVKNGGYVCVDENPSALTDTLTLCPVVIKGLESSSSAKAGLFAALTSSAPSNSYLILKYQNNSQKQVSGVRFVVAYLNSVREVVDTEDLTTPAQKLKPGKSFSLVRPDDYITNGQRVEIIGWVARVLFSDGSSWNDAGTKSCAVTSR